MDASDHVTLQLRPRSLRSHRKIRSLLPEGGTDARKAAPDKGGKLPGAGALPLPLLLLLLLLLLPVLRRYLRVHDSKGQVKNMYSYVRPCNAGRGLGQ